MFKHLLVPLDGSRLAEAALPAAAYLAQKLGASVTLIHIIERDAPPAVHGEPHLTNPDEACAYLNGVARRAFSPDLPVECHVHTGETADVARGIVDHAGEFTPDLIVMCTHGWGGLRGVLFGSIAQQVVARGTTPVLLIRPTPPLPSPAYAEGGEVPFTCRRLLVPLDGDPDHEHGLPVAAELARACLAGLHLVFVVPTLGTLSGEHAATGLLLPGATREVLELARQDAEGYLSRRVTRLQAQSLSVTAEVCRGDPTTAIVNTAQGVGADLIVLGTHGKLGMDAFWAGSITPKISSRSRLPLLLVPVPEPGLQNSSRG
jgi:nucleotide-binding universal stress UspA family protein